MHAGVRYGQKALRFVMKMYLRKIMATRHIITFCIVTSIGESLFLLLIGVIGYIAYIAYIGVCCRLKDHMQRFRRIFFGGEVV